MIRHLWPLGIGFAVWAAAFAGIYALQYLGCFTGWPETVHRSVLVLAYVSTIGVLGGLLALQVARARRRQWPALERAGTGATVAALAATVITFAPTPIASLCI